MNLIFLDIINDFFIRPIAEYQGYNLVNTLVYAVILLLVAFGIIYPLFKKKGIKFDFQFAAALIPYILFGIALRILEDQKILGRSPYPTEIGYYFVSPGIWLLIGGITIISLLVSMLYARKMKKGQDFSLKIFTGIGTAIAIPVIIYDLFLFNELIGFLAVLLTAAAVSFIAIKTSSLLHKKKFLEFNLFGKNMNKLALFAQVLDGSATFIALQFFKCGEQHVVSAAIINAFSPFSFLIVKLLLVTVILYFIDKEVKDKQLNGFIKVIIIILGFATGARDAFTLAVGTCS